MHGLRLPSSRRAVGAATGILLASVLVANFASALENRRRIAPRLRTVLVVFDGLRPDHITAARTPRLHALAAAGVQSVKHHALFPTVTRVNASALATGAGPSGHGILDNSIFLPAVDSTRVLDTGNGRDMMRADSVLGGRLLTAPTLAERLRAAGKRIMVASAGSSGSAYLFAGGVGTPTVNADLVQPAALSDFVHRTLGTPPADASPNLGRNAWAVEALLQVGVDSLDVDVGYLWLSDPDHTAHGAGLGSAMADSSIRAADREFGRLLDGLSARGVRDSVNIVVVSDHGFSTHGGDSKSLRRRLGSLADSVTVAGSAIHVRRGGTTTRDAVVQLLQGWPEAGAIFTAPASDSTVGAVPGTLSMSAIGWQHARSAEILFSADWSHEMNAAGHRGTTRQSGVAGHGTSSPWDIGATFVASGPAFRTRMNAPLPSSNADIVPTILHLAGMPANPPGVTGRVLHELLAKRTVTVPAVTRDSTVAEVRGYRTVLYRTRVGATWYMDSTRTIRRSQTGTHTKAAVGIDAYRRFCFWCAAYAWGAQLVSPLVYGRQGSYCPGVSL